MFDNKAKQQLEGLLSDLRNWGDSVETRAESFHRLRRLLQGDIETELKRLFPRKSQAENYIQRHRPLSKLALDLGDLLNQSQALDAELDELLILFTHERELSAIGEGTCRQWREELHKLPAACERETDVTRAKQEAEQIGQAVRLHIEALRAFQEADAIIRRLGSDADTAALETELQRSRLAMAAGRVSLEGARQIKKLCAPLEALLNRPEPQELQSLSGLLTEIREWNRSLEAPSDQERSLEQRRRQLGTDWRRRDADAWQVLLQEAENLRKQLITQGRALRDSKLAELEELLDDLVYALDTHQKGTQDIQDIRRRLATLKQGGWDSVHRHKDWLEIFKEAEADFSAITNDQEPALEKRLQEHCTHLKTQLRRLNDMPLADEIRRNAESLEQKTQPLCQPHEAHNLLIALRQSHRIDRQVAELQQQAAKDREELAYSQQKLRLDNEHLLQEAARIGCAVEDLTPSIEALIEGVLNRTLDKARQEAKSLATKLDDHRETLIRHCQTEQDARLTEINLHVAALCAAGFPVEAPNLPIKPIVLEEFAGRLDALAQECLRLQQLLAKAMTELEQRRDRQRVDLSDLTHQRLPPGEQEEAEALLAQMETDAAMAASPMHGPIERLRELADRVEIGAAFLERLSAEQQGWQQQLVTLKERLQTFKQERLHVHCSDEWLNHVADLTYGIPDPVAQEHLPQLREAKTLFDRLEQQALRLTAQIVDVQLAELEQHKHKHPKPHEVEALLLALRKLGDDMPVPVNLRLRLHNAAAALGKERSHHGRA
jgi:hypothetical protein